MSVHSSDKLASRVVPTIFICYPANQKGYKLLDPVTLQIHTSRHVFFHEDVFSFHTKIYVDMVPYTPPSKILTDDDNPLQVVFNDIPGSSTSTANIPVESSSEFFTYIAETLPNVTALPPRVSLRNKIQPSWMKDYHVSTFSADLSSSSTVLLNCLVDKNKYSFSHYSLTTKVFACDVQSDFLKEPTYLSSS